MLDNLQNKLSIVYRYDIRGSKAVVNVNDLQLPLFPRLTSTCTSLLKQLSSEKHQSIVREGVCKPDETGTEGASHNQKPRFNIRAHQASVKIQDVRWCYCCWLHLPNKPQQDCSPAEVWWKQVLNLPTILLMREIIPHFNKGAHILDNMSTWMSLTCLATMSFPSGMGAPFSVAMRFSVARAFSWFPVSTSYRALSGSHCSHAHDVHALL